jgi:hypothetical protein
MSLRRASVATWQSPVRGDCFAVARNDMWQLQSPSLHFGDATQSASEEELRLLFGRTLTSSPNPSTSSG